MNDQSRTRRPWHVDPSEVVRYILPGALTLAIAALTFGDLIPANAYRAAADSHWSFQLAGSVILSYGVGFALAQFAQLFAMGNKVQDLLADKPVLKAIGSTFKLPPNQRYAILTSLARQIRVPLETLTKDSDRIYLAWLDVYVLNLLEKYDPLVGKHMYQRGARALMAGALAVGTGLLGCAKCVAAIVAASKPVTTPFSSLIMAGILLLAAVAFFAAARMEASWRAIQVLRWYHQLCVTPRDTQDADVLTAQPQRAERED